MARHMASNPVQLVDTGRYRLWGHPIPENIERAEVIDDIYGDKVVRWVCKDNPTVHRMEMRFVTHETIRAVLVAMRLSC